MHPQPCDQMRLAPSTFTCLLSLPTRHPDVLRTLVVKTALGEPVLLPYHTCRPSRHPTQPR